MRVALDEQIFALQEYGGISRLFAELARQFLRFPSAEVELQPLRAPVANRYLLDDTYLRDALQVRQARNPWTALARYAIRPPGHPSADIVHNTFYLPHGLAPARGAKRVVTVHDMIPELLPRTRRRLDLLTMKRRYVESADHIICISEATKQDLIRVYPEAEVPMSVVHHGVDERFAPVEDRLPGLPESYVLMVGNRSQYKDGMVLFEAFARFAPDFPDLHLVCAGGGAFTRTEKAWVAGKALEGRIHQRTVPDAGMPALYSGATVFVFPSRFEGFGLPALEAMACGVPAVLADATSLPEVGGSAASYFPVGDAQALAASIASLLDDAGMRAQRAAVGIERARSFTWTRTAELTAQAYARAMGEAA